MLIRPDQPQQSSREFWRDELQNLRALLYEYDRAIADLVAGKITEYRLDSGQSSQTVKRTDLTPLQTARESLMIQIDTVEKRVNGGTAAIIHPGW